MMNRWSVPIALATTLAATATANEIVLRRDTVVPVVFETELSMNKSRPNDPFVARVNEATEVPRGTVFEGRVVEIVAKTDKHPAYMDLEFTHIVFPTGERRVIRALPIALDAKGMKTDRDGRMVFERPKGDDSTKAVLTGALGGLILGSLIQKPFEGLFAGTLAGIIVGETSRGQNNGVVVKKGDRMGALIERDFVYEYRGGPEPRPIPGPDNPRSVAIQYENRDLRFMPREMPYRERDTVMVPVIETARQLGLQVDVMNDGRVLLIDAGDQFVRVTEGESRFRLKRDFYTMPERAVIRDRVFYAPVDAIAILLDRPLTINGERYRPNVRRDD